MNNKEIKCEDVQIMLMGMLDGELQPEDESRVNLHLKSCSNCRQQYQSFKSLKEDTLDMKFKQLPDMYWDEYWTHVYNKMERGIGWIFLSVGIIILSVYGMIGLIRDFVLNDAIPLVIRGGVTILGVGFVILAVSVLREKLMIRKVDKYRSVIR